MICAPAGSILAEERLPTTTLTLGLPADGYLTLNAVEAMASLLSVEIELGKACVSRNYGALYFSPLLQLQLRPQDILNLTLEATGSHLVTVLLETSSSEICRGPKRCLPS